MNLRRLLGLVIAGGLLLPSGLDRNSVAFAEDPPAGQAPFNFEEASRDVLKPRQVYPL